MLLMIAAFVSTPVALADDSGETIRASAQIRARMEGDDKSFNEDMKMYSFTLLRTRLNIDLYPDSPVKGFIQIQDSRLMGDPDLESGGTDNDMNVGLHQAFMLVKCKKIDGAYFKVGRFEYSKGDERILGNVGWSNVGRTWDGAVIGLKKDNFIGEIFGFEINERNPEVSDDVLLLGGYFEIIDPSIELFILWDRDNARDFNDNPALNRITIGVFRHGEFQQFDYTTNLAYQFGDMNYDVLDISAYLATLEMGYTFDTEKPLRLAAGVDIASGDDDMTDDDAETYSNLYYTGHKFRGHMDFFVSPSGFDLYGYGLNDIFVKAKYEPKEKIDLNGHFHLFGTNTEYISRADGDEVKSLGGEIDLFVNCRPYDRLKVQIGGSAFFPSEDWKGEDADPAYWMYFQTTAEF
jgi:hypothetical protein